jgi:hypothetical protein
MIASKRIYDLQVRYICLSVCLSLSLYLSLFVNYHHLPVNFIPALYSDGQTSNRLPMATMIDIFVAVTAFPSKCFGIA